MILRRKVPDKNKAKSLIEAAEKEMEFIGSIKPSEEAAPTLIRSIYENFRMLGEALLTIRGLEAIGKDHHTQMINELLKLEIKTERPLLLLNELKRIRHNINYQGYIPSEAELQNVISIKEALWKPVIKEVKRQVGLIQN